MLDLSKLDPKKSANQGAAVEIKIDGEPTGAVIYARGKYSDIAEKMQQAAIRKVGRNFKKNGKFVPDDPVDQQEERILYVTACTLGWEGITGEDGKPLEYSEANARALYAKHKWILDQVDLAIADDSLFLKT